MFNPRSYENSRPDGIAVLEVLNEEAEQPASLPFVPLQRTELHGTITGPLADLYLTQVFRYASAMFPDPIEAHYRFPLPGDAAVRGITVRFGEVEIRAALQERATAEATYAEAKASGRQATLATRESPDVFTLHITGLQPDQPVTIETHYLQLARADQSGFSATGNRIPQWSLRIPLTTAPRYVRDDEHDSRWAQGQPLAPLRDPGHRFLLDLNFQGVATVTSPTHELTTLPSTPTPTINTKLAAGEVIPDRDCLLLWSPPQQETAPTIQLLTYRDEHKRAEEGVEVSEPMLYFLAMITPPTQPPEHKNRREATLLVDHSGSMRGAKWSAADWAVERFLSDLNPEDTFALATFHNQTRWFEQRIQPAQPTLIDRGVQWLQQQRDSGGTQLGVALEQALQLGRTTRAPTHTTRTGTEATSLARHLLIVTDAAVSDAARILRLADAEALRSDHRRISVLCIDAAPNAFLAHELAERGGGVARFLTSDPAQDDIVTALDDLLLEWSEPLLVNMQLVINREQVTISGHQSRTGQAHPSADKTSANQTTDNQAGSGQIVIDLGDLPAGRTQWIVGRLPLPTDANSTEISIPIDSIGTGSNIEIMPLTFTLTADHAGVQHSFTALTTELPNIDSLNTDSPNTDPLNTDSGALKALFGARRINALEFLINANYDQAQLGEQLHRLGYDPSVVLHDQTSGQETLYAENVRSQASAALHNLLVQEALDYGLASAETAFVATRSEAGEPIATSVIVANALPAGWSDSFAASASMPVTRGMMGAHSLPPAFDMQDTTSKRTRSIGERLGQAASSFRLASAAPTGITAMRAPAPDDTTPDDTGKIYTLFTGIPQFDGQTAVLFASASMENVTLASAETNGPNDQLSPPTTITALTLTLPTEEQTLQPDRSVTLTIYIDDLIAPRATIRLHDLLRQGTRPLNLHCPAATPLHITLNDPTGSLRDTNVAISLSVTMD